MCGAVATYQRELGEEREYICKGAVTIRGTYDEGK